MPLKGGELVGWEYGRFSRLEGSRHTYFGAFCHHVLMRELYLQYVMDIEPTEDISKMSLIASD